MKSSIVLGSQFGDEGKGHVVSYLVSKSEHPLVVRFNGGHQAGHTVVMADGKRHVFSHFGSGTLQGAPTFWSRFCTVSPGALVSEWNELHRLGVTPKIYIDSLCPVTTPYDIYYNQIQNSKTNHGSVGVGFGATIERHEKYFKLYAGDLQHPSVLKGKLQNIYHYYKDKLGVSFIPDFRYVFTDTVDEFMSLPEEIEICESNYLNPIGFDHIIFEGAQGILLDMDFGFFPNVTRSNTTSKNAMQLIKENWLMPVPEIFYVTRSYQTRHGNGYMTNEAEGIELKNNEHETNIDFGFQGKFRKSKLDIDLLKYALECDNHFSDALDKNLVITCTDQYEDEVTKKLPLMLGVDFKDVLISSGDQLHNIQSQLQKQTV